MVYQILTDSLWPLESFLNLVNFEATATCSYCKCLFYTHREVQKSDTTSENASVLHLNVLYLKPPRKL